MAKTNGDYLLNGRVVARYTASPELHFELVYDRGLSSRNILTGDSLGLFVRSNF